MAMPGRKYSAGSKYRYGFNGKEKDLNLAEDGYDFGARIYDSRICRWLSVDPLQAKYPSLSPFIFAANSPINAIDPDGKVIIFINGFWGPPTGLTPGEEYWGKRNGKKFTELVQDAIGDHKQPRFYDGSMGGSLGFSRNSNMPAKNRIAAGKIAGYNDAKDIISKLGKDETIKIVTNSMGAAFERGFTEGLLQYQSEENNRRTNFNAGIDKILAPLIDQKNFLESLNGVTSAMTDKTKKKMAADLAKINSNIADLQSQKKEMLDIEIEMVIDLSAHQIDYADPNAKKNYYMTAEENINTITEFLVDEKKHIRNSWWLGKMDRHHAVGADPSKLPKAANPN